MQQFVTLGNWHELGSMTTWFNSFVSDSCWVSIAFMDAVFYWWSVF